ncbi:MAG: helix-turn-helix transcriptional regulator [Lachnospiraceae bacterium]|nr:helix-turn-helix transcriptional regulator [Lachnospiraceae bacterium]
MGVSRLKLLKQMAYGIASEFGSNCEVVVHDLSSKHINNSVVFIVNGHVTDREIGSGASPAVLNALRKHGDELKDQYAYLTRTDNGRILKSTTIYIKDDDGTPRYALGINYDITNLLAFEGAIRSLTDTPEDPNDAGHDVPRHIPQDINAMLDELIEQSVALVGVPVPFMTKNDKIKAINYLNDAGAFLITKSGDKVSKYFGISKYTLYSYVDINK